MKNLRLFVAIRNKIPGWSLLPVIRIIGHCFDPRLTQTVRALAIFCYERLGELQGKETVYYQTLTLPICIYLEE